MRALLPFLPALLVCLSSCDSTSPTHASTATGAVEASSIYDLTETSLDGQPVRLNRLKGKVTLFVNVASQCGYTPQYEGLQTLFDEMGGSTFTVVGIPSNDFGDQEPGSAAEIAQFCKQNYGVKFQMLAKTGTSEGESVLFDRLAAMTGKRPSWNFGKYLVSKDGTQAQFFETRVRPDGAEMRQAIDKMRGL